MCMKLLVKMPSLVSKYNNEFLQLIVHVIRWITHFDLRVVESALGLLQLLL